MRKWLILLFFALIIGACVWYFWSLGNLSARQGQDVSLSIDNEGVEFQRSGSDSWQTARNGDALQAGDTVKTGTGAVTITFFDLSQVRLAPQTLVKLEEASMSDEKPFTVRLRLEEGRAWSRILRLLELDGTFVVVSDPIVATVRGTAFDLSRSSAGTSITVFDSAVEVVSQTASSDQGSKPLVVSEGFTVSFDQAGKLQETKIADDGYGQDDWVAGNVKRDAAFSAAAQDRLLAYLGDLDLVQPEGLFDGLARLSEKMHLALSSDAPALYVGYVERRLAAIKRLVERGKSGAAFNALVSTENEISEKTASPDAEKYRMPLLRVLFDISSLMANVGPSSDLYRMKQRLEDMQVKLAGTDALEVAYARMRAIDARLDEALMLVGQSSLDDAAAALDAARQGLVNVERDIDGLPESAPSDRLTALRGKLNVMKAREGAYRVRLATAIAPPQREASAPAPAEGTTSTPSDLATSTTDGAQIPISDVPVSYETISLSAAPGQALVGQSVQLKVRAIKADGGQTDVTSQSSFEVTGPAKADGSTLTPSAVGKVSVTAIYLSGLDRFEARLTLDVKEAPVVALQSLRLSTTSPDDLVYGSAATLTATAVYSDGTTKDVTDSTSFSSSNLRLGFTSKNVFSAGAESTGQVQVMGSYSEAGKVVTASRTFNIIAR